MKKKISRKPALRSEYDFTRLAGGERGKYYGRVEIGTTVTLDADIASAFPTDEAVNHALRAVMDAASAMSPAKKPPAQRRKAKAASKPKTARPLGRPRPKKR